MNSISTDHAAGMVRYVRVTLRNLLVCCLIQGALLALVMVLIGSWYLAPLVALLSLLAPIQGLAALADLSELHSALREEAAK